MSLPGNTDAEKLEALSQQNYKAQAVWFLNAFWNTIGEQEAENVWEFVHHCNDLDLQDKEEGNHLDEMMAHRFLELIKSTLTVREMREGLRAVGIEKVKHVPLINFLIFKYKIDWHKLVNASQGDNQEEVERAQQMLNEVMKALAEVKASASAAAKAEVEAINAENAAKQAKAELEEALAALHAEEEAYNTRKKTLEQKCEEGGVVSRNKAKAELSQLLAEDPLPLRRAKITQEAAVKKAERTAQAAEQATADAKAAREAAEKAVEEAQRQVAEAEAYLQEVKSKPGSAAGALWWIDRELHEQKKYLPVSKGGIAKK